MLIGTTALSIFILGILSASAADEDPEIRKYRVGARWGKSALTVASMRLAPSVWRKAAQSTARYDGATGIYLGKFGGEHVLATNFHVINGTRCGPADASFKLLNDRPITIGCKRHIGKWSQIELGLVALDIPSELESAFNQIGVNFSFDSLPGRDAALTTIGFGYAGNPDSEMMLSQDEDCKVYSGSNDIRFVPDPDTWNRASHKTWSFAHGCDISHGDSGSPIFARRSGKLVGLNWTGAAPKSPQVQDPLSLRFHLQPWNPIVWTKLNYGVPAVKIREELELALPGLSAADAEIVQAIIGKSPGR